MFEQNSTTPSSSRGTRPSPSPRKRSNTSMPERLSRTGRSAARPDVTLASLPMGRTLLFDPPGELRELRESTPLSRVQYENGDGVWLVTSHALARSILTDPR